MILLSITSLIDPSHWEYETAIFAYFIIAATAFGFFGLIGQAIHRSVLFKSSNVGSRVLAPYFQKYQRGFIAGTAEKTHHHAADLFPLRQLAYSQGILSSLPNLLVGLGILGTFVGLSIGVMGLKDQGSAEAIQAGIQSLLDSMSTAFVTSVLGMGGSIVLTIVHRIAGHWVAYRHKKFCAELDDRHYVTEEELHGIEEARMEAMLIRLFGSKMNEEVTSPGTLLVRNLQANQSTAAKLDNFGNELADGLMLSASTISAIESSLGSRFQDLFKNHLGTYLDSMEKSLVEISGESRNNTESFTDTLESTLNRLIESFKGELSQGAKEEMMAVHRSLASTAESIAGLPAIIDSTKTGFESMTLQFEELGKEVARRIAEQLKAAGEAAEEATKSSMDKARDAANTVIDESSRITEKLLAGLEGYMRANSSSVEGISEMIDRIQSVLKEHENSGAAIGAAITGLTHASNSLQRNTGDMASSFQAMKAMNESMERTSSSLNAVASGMSEVVKGQEELLMSAFDRAKQSIDEQLEAYGEVNEELGGIKEAYVSSLQAYQEAVNRAVNSNLEAFASQLTGVAEGLTAAYTALQETVGEMEGAVTRVGRELN